MRPLQYPRPKEIVLVASADREVAERLARELTGHAQVQLVTDVDAIGPLFASQLLQGAVLDMALLGREALALAKRFVECQPRGRAVVLEDHSGPRTLVDLSLRDHRVEVLSRPLDLEALRDCFLREPVGAR